MNAQMACCVQSYIYKIVFTDESQNPAKILQTHLDDPMLYRLSPIGCCKDCCVDERESSILYKVIHVDENQQDYILRNCTNDIGIVNKPNGEN